MEQGGSSSSSGGSSSSMGSSSSGGSTTSSSSGNSSSSGGSVACKYQPAWCNGKSMEEVTFMSGGGNNPIFEGDCVFVENFGTITMSGNQIKVNGNLFTNWQEVNKDMGTADGGYYVYMGLNSGLITNVVPGKKTCEYSPGSSSSSSSGGGGNGSSSSRGGSSSSGGGGSCDFKPSWCNGKNFVNYRGSYNNQLYSGDCVFIKDFGQYNTVTSCTNSVIINNTIFTPCYNFPYSELPPKADGGFYIYANDGSATIGDFQEGTSTCIN
jgi:hypothetical protein